MAEGNIIAVGFLNVVASPHPEGIYGRSLLAVANKPIRYRGKDYAVILAPRQNADDPLVWEGTLSLWTDVDASEPSIDKATFERKDVEKELRDIFAQRGFNNRGFSYVLDESTHTIAVELLNDTGKTLSIKSAGKIFEMAFSSLNKEGETFDVTVKPEEDALERVLGFSRIDKIHIVLKRPNPGDHHGDDANEVLRELEEQNMKRAEYVFSRQPGTDGIRLNETNRTIAEVAAHNGHVDSSGVDEDDEHDKRSTKEYPRIVRRTLAVGTVFLSALRNEAMRFRVG